MPFRTMGSTRAGVQTPRRLFFLLFAAVLIFGLCSCSGSDLPDAIQGREEERPVKCVPEIEQDAFRTGQALTLLEPDPHALNDHCIFQDSAGRFHLLAIDGGAPWQFHNSLAHGVGETLDTPMVRNPDLLPSIYPECTIWAPFGTIHNGKIYLYYTDAHYCESGPLDIFSMNLATASVTNPFLWEKQGVLFWERGYARDPHVIWEPGAGQWVMFFNRKIEYTKLCGLTAVSYKVSPDLIHWSAETRDVISDIPDTQIYSGAAESPQVVFYRGYWYLFFTHPVFFQDYNATFVFRSETPYDFGTFHEPVAKLHVHAPEVFSVDGGWYITHAGDIIGGVLYGDPDYRPPGVQIARLRWVSVE